jgi:hypothetical protein
MQAEEEAVAPSQLMVLLHEQQEVLEEEVDLPIPQVVALLQPQLLEQQIQAAVAEVVLRQTKPQLLWEPMVVQVL